MTEAARVLCRRRSRLPARRDNADRLSSALTQELLRDPQVWRRSSHQTTGRPVVATQATMPRSGVGLPSLPGSGYSPFKVRPRDRGYDHYLVMTVGRRPRDLESRSRPSRDDSDEEVLKLPGVDATTAPSISRRGRFFVTHEHSLNQRAPATKS